MTGTFPRPAGITRSVAGRAAGLLVGELSRLDRESRGAVLAGTDPDEVYRGTLTAVMRLVVLLYAEEHGLRPAPRECALAGDAGLFGPGRHPWLEKAEFSEQAVREILSALLAVRQFTQVEQIGQVYEGLLGFTCAREDGPTGDLVIVPAGGRRASGSHYTPRELADEVVEHTLAPLCYSPGPADGAGTGAWRVRPAAELLSLTVADPAMGSGAFLLSACRYLADRLVQAWERDGYPDGLGRDGAGLGARRQVAAHCLFGVDQDDAAVELSKRSFWLLTRAEELPFSFLDHRLRCGDSLVGAVSAGDPCGPATSQAARPFHWAREFPEVMGNGGFDAVVSNPPFIGGKKISRVLGRGYREYLKQQIARGKPGNADLCAYFLLRSLALAPHGRVGIVATNTVAQGGTRAVGLDQAVETGWAIYRAEKSRPWPGAASLEVALVWAGHPGAAEPIILDGRRVAGITPSLGPRSRITGNPHRLAANAGQASQGAIVLGNGFILRPAEAHALIEQDPRNSDVLARYLNADDLNSRPDSSASRWVINFGEMTEQEASRYPEVFSIAEQRIKQARGQKDPARYPRMVHEWWKYWNPRLAMLKAIAGFDRVLVIARHSRTGLPQFVRTDQVMSDATVVFTTDRPAALALLSSSMHFFWWTTMGESSLRADCRYTPSDGFETFPQPILGTRLDRAGEDLDSFRREVMGRRRLGLTALHGLISDARVQDEDIVSLRKLHAGIDDAVRAAYARDEDADPGIGEFEAQISATRLPRWPEIDLGHGCHPTRYGNRFSISPQARADVLDKLLALNHYRHAQEMQHRHF